MKYITLLIMVGLSLTAHSHAAEYHVNIAAAKSGNGSEAAPFRTISEAVRILKPGDTCWIHAGVYRETVEGIPSGTAKAPIRICRFKNDKVVISGCDPVAGWKKSSKDKIYMAKVAMTLDDGNQVFVDGKMAWEARWPNAGGVTAKYLLEHKQAVMVKGTTPTKIVAHTIPERDWTGGSVWVSSHRRWYSWTSKIKGQGKGALLIHDNTDAGRNHIAKPGGVFYIYGCRAALDSENEWWYDSARECLFLCPPGGGDPLNRVEVKNRQVALDLSGTSHVMLKGFTVFGASIVTDDDCKGLTLDDLRLLYIHHSNKAEARYGSQGASGIRLAGNGHVMRNCELAYSSGNGLLLAGKNMQVINNYIHDCNYIGSYCAPLKFNRGGRDHLVSHNTIVRSGRSCIATPGFHNCILQYNDIGYAGYLTWDLGLTYGNGVDCGNSEVRYNWFHHNISRDHCNGVYFDHGCKNLMVHHNVVWNVKHKGFNNNQYANYLLYYHNTAINTQYGYASSWAAGQAQDLYGCRVANNLSTGGTKIKGEGLVQGKNLWNTKGLKDKRVPPPAAIDAAERVPGLKHETEGKGPDIGAYEAKGTQWKAGHDFKNPPTMLDTSRSKPAYRNLLTNPAWYHTDTSGWKLRGECKTISTPHGQWETGKLTMMGSCGIQMGPKAGATIQTVTGLQPNTTYELMGMFRVEPGGKGALVVIQKAGRKASKPVLDTTPKAKPNAKHRIALARQKNRWQRRLLRFTTGADETEVTVSAQCLPGGTGLVYADDMGLMLIGKPAAKGRK